jgi:hypothetical protein
MSSHRLAYDSRTNYHRWTSRSQLTAASALCNQFIDIRAPRCKSSVSSRAQQWSQQHCVRFMTVDDRGAYFSFCLLAPEGLLNRHHLGTVLGMLCKACDVTLAL